MFAFPVPRPRTRPGRRRGFTLLEIAVVVAVLGIMAAVGYGSIRDQLPRYRMIRAAKELEQDIENLRMEAILANRETRILLVEADPDPSDPSSYGGAWELQGGDSSMMSTTWEYMPFDEPGAGDMDQSEGRVRISDGGNRKERGVGLSPWGEISGPGTGNADAIVFSPRGWVTNPASDFDAQGYVTLKLVNKSALRHGVQDQVHLRIARSGYMRLETTLGNAREDFGVGTTETTRDGS